jgi:antitoxin StbD
MTRLLTRNICTMTELREPQKVLDRAGGKPVAVLKNSRCVGYFVPEEFTQGNDHQPMSMDELRTILKRTRKRTQPVLDYLKYK